MKSDRVNPGRLRHRVTIQRPAASSPLNGFGEPGGPAVTFAAAYASIQALQGREFEAAQRLWADARFLVELQYLAGVTTEMRILDDEGRTLNILDVEDPEGNRARLVMYCSEVK